MSLWLLLLAGLVLTSGFSAILICLRYLHKKSNALRDQLALHHTARLAQTDQLMAQLERLQLERQTLDRILTFQVKEQETKEKLWLGAFLPTDAHAQNLEQQMMAAEDHAVSAAGPTPWSPLPSRASAARSATGRSTRGARSSGNR